MATVKGPWKVYALISALYEFVASTFLVLHIAIAFVVYELGRHLPVARSCSFYVRRRHALFCSGHFPPFSPCWECNGGHKEALGLGHSPSAISRGRASSEDLLASGDGIGSRRAGLSNQKRSASFSSICRSRDSMLTRPGCKAKCVPSNGGLAGEFIEGNAEWLKQQKDRGNDEVILSLLKALQAERRISRILYEELEEERVAAETAVNEAMAMILRLQEEKSALKLQAAQYQRLAEEKVFHDEQAIQLLEEELCRKESEWHLLEEELKFLTRQSVADEAKGMPNEPLYRESGKPLALLKGVNEATDMEDGDMKGETAMSVQDMSNLQRQSAKDDDAEECFEATLITKDTRLKRLKNLAAFEEDGETEHLDSSEWVEDKAVTESSIQMEKPVALAEEEHDASSLLIQLSALEIQLSALEKSESWSPFNECFKMPTLASTHGPLDLYDKDQNAQSMEQWCISKASENADASEAFGVLRNEIALENTNASKEILKASGSTKASEKRKVSEPLEESGHGKAQGSPAKDGGLSQILDDEKVVGIDFTNINRNPHQESGIFDTGEFLECDEGKHPKIKSVHCEMCKEDKNVDFPSFLPSSRSNSFTTRNDVERCKLDVHGLAPLARVAEEEVNADTVTLQGIDLRLQVLENENSLLRHRSVPSRHERLSMVLLKEIMQELQELLKANNSTAAAARDNVEPQSDAHLKGGQLKKRHYMDRPAHSS